MKKLIPLMVLVGLLLTTTAAFAHPSKSVYVEWTWQGEKSAYFKSTGSGLVHAWSYDHPTYGDSHWVMKPYDKFPNAMTCDEGYLGMYENWTPSGIYNSADAMYQDDFEAVFDKGLTQNYLLCIYPMD